MGEDNFRIFKKDNDMKIDSSCIFKYENRRDYKPRDKIIKLYKQGQKIKFPNLTEDEYCELA